VAYINALGSMAIEVPARTPAQLGTSARPIRAQGGKSDASLLDRCGQLPAGKEIVLRLAEGAPSVGSRMTVGAPRERLHLFDLERGRRL